MKIADFIQEQLYRRDFTSSYDYDLNTQVLIFSHFVNHDEIKRLEATLPQINYRVVAAYSNKVWITPIYGK